MRISTESLTERIGALAGLDGIEIASLTGDEVMTWLSAGGRARQALDAVLAALTSRVDELSRADDRGNRFARRKGFSDAGALVADVAQVPRGEAGRLVTLGQAMSDADAGSGGELAVGIGQGEGEVVGPKPPALYEFLTYEVARGFSTEKAAIIRATLQAMAGATVEIERSLVERARKRSVSQVRVMCRYEFQRVDHEGYLRQLRASRPKRYVKFWDDDDGMVSFRGRLDPMDAIPLRTWLEDQVRKGRRSQRKVHPSERLGDGQLAADALADLAQHRLGCQDPGSHSKSMIVVQVNAEDLKAGTGPALCHGYAGPICVEMLGQLLTNVGVAPAIMGSNGLPMFLGMSSRFFSPAQKLAIALRDGGCARCGKPIAYCDVHHIKFWSHGGPTDIDNGVLLCSACHHQLHDFGWVIEVVEGEVWFIPPSEVDPRRERIPACATRLAHQ